MLVFICPYTEEDFGLILTLLFIASVYFAPVLRPPLSAEVAFIIST